MKASPAVVKRQARRLFDLARVDGRMDEARLRTVVEEVSSRQPRGCVALLKNLLRRAEIEKRLHTAHVETPVPLPAPRREMLARSLKGRYGADLDIRYIGNPALLGGVRIRVGDTLVDGSIQGRLETLRSEF